VLLIIPKQIPPASAFAADIAAIKQLEADIEALEAALNGEKPRKAVGVVPRDW